MDDGTKIPVKELFYYYNLVSYQNKNGERTLTSIFDNYSNTEIPKQYRKKLRELDRTFTDDDLYSSDILNISDREIAFWCSEIENPFTSYSKYLYYKDKESMTVELMERSSSDPEVDDSERNGVGGYDRVKGVIKDPEGILNFVPVDNIRKIATISSGDNIKV
jgi:hypothetical protein